MQGPNLLWSWGANFGVCFKAIAFVGTPNVNAMVEQSLSLDLRISVLLTSCRLIIIIQVAMQMYRSL